MKKLKELAKILEEIEKLSSSFILSSASNYYALRINKLTKDALRLLEEAK
jgi:hypothetical protein